MHSTDSLRRLSAHTVAPRTRPSQMRHARLAPRELERLVNEVRNLVPMFARRYIGRGVAFEDLVGAGNVGIVEAAYRFDPNRGVKFSSYAAWWIRKAITSAVGTSASVVSIPRYSFERRRLVLEAIKSGRPAAEHDRSAGDVAEGLGLSQRQVEHALSFSMGCVSLDAPVAGDDGTRWSDRLARRAEEGPEHVAIDAERSRAAWAALEVLNPRQRTVLALRFGIGGQSEEPASLTDVGKIMGLSRERVRQIEHEALALVRGKLRKSGRRRSS